MAVSKAALAKAVAPRPHLGAFRSAILDLVRSATLDLSLRQISVLMECQDLHTVRDLAEHLRVGKPVITRATQSLQAMGYVTKDRDPTNLRSVDIRRTRDGDAYVRRTEAILAKALPVVAAK